MKRWRWNDDEEEEDEDENEKLDKMIIKIPKIPFVIICLCFLLFGDHM